MYAKPGEHVLTALSMISTKKSVSLLQTTMQSCNKGMLSEIVYMLAGHSTPTINRQCYIPVNSIVAEHGVKLCENLPTTHVLTECHKQFILNRNVCAYTKLQDLVGNGKQSSTIFDIKKLIHAPSKRLFVLSLPVYGIKARNCSSLDKI
jgi:hypothetical protein